MGPISWFSVALKEFLSFREWNIQINYSRQMLNDIVEEKSKVIVTLVFQFLKKFQINMGQTLSWYHLFVIFTW